MAAKYHTRFGTAYQWQLIKSYTTVHQATRRKDGFDRLYIIRPVPGRPRTWEIALYTGWGMWEAVPNLSQYFTSARHAAKAFAQEFPAC